MDTLRDNYGLLAESEAGPIDDDFDREAPPPAIGQDERRLQVRAYNYWASQLAGRLYPSIDELEPAELPEFAPYSVLLDFTAGVQNPGIAYLGEALCRECGVDPAEISCLADVPGRSLLSRITDHYMQILANQAPIGFEAEFVNLHGVPVLYRGILLPYSSDDDTIDFILGVISWKELADQQAADELLLEIDQALEPQLPRAREFDGAPMPDWADGPDAAEEIEAQAGAPVRAPLDLSGGQALAAAFGAAEDAFDHTPLIAPEAPLSAAARTPAGAGLPLAEWLSAAREMAAAARSSEDRTRQALYQAIGRAYDFSLAAAAAPEEFAALVAEAGLAVQERAPMTPVVKLVFGADYDKTRLTEYAAALSLAHRMSLPLGSLGDYLAEAPGGLKAVVQAERRLRREDQGKPAPSEPEGPRRSLARKLRALPARELSEIAPQGSEFALVMIRRSEDGAVAVLGEVPADARLVERAARSLLG